jgi:Amt family ammonium transporter
MKLTKTFIIIFIVAIVISLSALWFKGASSDGITTAINTGDTAWVLAAAALVMIMTPAVGFFYGGMVRSKNVISIIHQSFVILAIISIQWVVIGYSLVFGKDFHGIIGGLDFFGLRNVGYAPNTDYAATIPQLVFMIFQAKFAIITPALIIGAIAERINFKALIIFTVLWTTCVYDPVAHWVWGMGGWLRGFGALDFAGGTVVHVTAGFAGLIAAMMVGRRYGMKSHSTPAHNIPFVLLGAALLWFGWFGFNAGSALGANGLAASAFVTTNTAAGAAALVWMILSWVQFGKPSGLATATGAICGLVAITPASGYVGPIASIAIGIIGGAVTYIALLYRTHKTYIDDALDVWAAHGMGGVTGALLTGIFAEKVINTAGNNGLLFGNPSQLFVQIMTVAVTAGYTVVVTWLLLFILKKTIGLRVTTKEEQDGLDLSLHGEKGYERV